MKKISTLIVSLILLMTLFTANVQAQSATALKFDPSLAVNDFSRLNYVGIDNPFTAYQKEITVEFWMYAPSANLPFGSVMGQGTSNDAQNVVWLMHPNTNGTMTFFVNDGGATLRSATINIIAGSWHHYAGVASATSTKFYVDGVLINTGPGISSTVLSNPTSVIHIGKDVRFATRFVANNDPFNRYATMTIDEVRIWSRALCEDEIKSNKNCELFNPTAQNKLENYYNFNQGIAGGNNATVTTLNDLSGNNRNGTLYNFSLNGANSNWVTSGSTNNGTCLQYVAPTAAITGSTSICLGTSTTLSNSISGGVWTSSNTSVATINASSGLLNSVALGTTIIKYTTECGGVSTTALTVGDVIPPTISCTTNKVLASCETVIPDYTTSATVSDNCTAVGSIVVTQSPAAGTAIAPGASVSVTLTAKDASNNTATCSFTVNRPNITPVANNDAATVCAGSSVNISVLSNDTHPQNLALTVSDNTVPSAGSLVKNADNTFTYTAPANYSGPVTFTYTTKANDGTQAFAGNGHYYQFVSSPGITWTAARAAASAMTFNGLKGYLVTITSAAENTFMFNKVGTTAWIGGSDMAQEGVWKWMDGPEAGQQFSGQMKYGPGNCTATTPPQLAGSYHNWAPGEPNDCGGTAPGSHAEDYAHFRSDGQWNDFPNNAGVSGYAVEYGGLENCLPVLTATATVTITVNPLPVATIAAAGGTNTCPGNAVTLNANTGSGYTYQWKLNGNNISGATNASFAAAAIGSYSVVITSNSCVSLVSNAIAVTVSDVTPPTITCPANQTLDLDANCNAALPDYRSLVTASDNCTASNALVITQSPVAGTVVSTKGAQIITFTVTDASKNSSTCTITVDKQDVTAPVITCPAPKSVNNSSNTCGAVVTYINPTATDNCSGAAFHFWNSGEPNDANAAHEDYLQLYNSGTWNDLPNSVLNKSIVEFNSIISTTFANYSLIGTFGGHTYYISNGTATWTSSRTSAQAIGGDLASINTLAESQYLAPKGGNTWVGGYQDHSDPAYVEPGNASQNYGGWKWVDGTKLGSGQIIITQIAGLQSGSTFPIGVTTNTFRAIDESNNSSTCSFTVTVVDNQRPVINNCPADQTVTATSASGAVVIYTAPIGSDNCPGAETSLTAGLPSGATFPLGTTSVTYTVKDAAGLTASCTFNVTVSGRVPVINCPANISVSNTPGLCGANVNFAATETIGIPASTITYSIQPGTSFPVGTITVTATATNAIGSNSCSFNVTVVDNQAPVIGQMVGNPDPSNTTSRVNVFAKNVDVWHGGSPYNHLRVVNADIDGDGDQDLIYTTYNSPLVYRNNGKGVMTGEQVVSSGPSNCVAVGDVNGDGSPDIVLGFWSNNGTPQSRLYLNDGHGNFTLDVSNLGGTERVNDVKIADLNGDGYPDLFFVGSGYTNRNHRVYFNDGHGHFTASTQLFNTDDWGESVVLRDFDGNGTIDAFVVSNYPVNSTRLWLNDGHGNFTAGSQSFQAGENVDAVDIDNDGDFDIAYATGDAQQIKFLINNGNGTFTSSSQSFSVPGNPQSMCVKFVDIDVDGYKDIVIAFAGATQPVIFHNNGSGSFSLGNSIPIQYAYNQIREMIFPDMDGDGDPDFVDANYGWYNEVLFNQLTHPTTGGCSNITVNSAPGQCGATVTYSHTVTDNCSATISYLPASGSFFPVGTTPVTATAVDPSNNKSTCTFNVTVLDNIPPVISCPLDRSDYATSASGAVITYTTPIGTDNCSGVTTVRTAGLGSGSAFPIGTTTVTYRATDASGNFVDCSFTVTIKGLPPVIKCPMSISVPNTPGACGTNVSFAATETTGIPASTITYSIQPGTFFQVGTTTVTATATNAVGSSSCAFTVTVTDTQFPVLIGVPSDITVECDAVPAAATVTATDNCTTSVPTFTETRADGNCANNYTLTRTWSTTDASNNTTSATQVITVQDTKAPELTVPADISVLNDNNVCVATVRFAATATDNCSTPTITYSQNPGTVFAIGSTVVTVTATDACGNATTKSFTVTVSDTQFPVLVGVPANTTVECDAVPAAATVTATDNCTTSVPTFTETRADGNCANNYTLTRTWSTTDASGNNTTQSQIITVQDTKAPILSAAPADVTVECNAVPDEAVLTATDNCDPSPLVTFSQTRTDGNCPSNYTLTRIWKAKDACGNASSKTQVIRVQDTQAPVLSQAPADVTVECNAVPDAAVLTATDNCDASPVVTYTQTRTDGNCPNNYTLTRTWTAKDACGNTSSKTQVIKVQDTQAPVLSAAPANVTVECNAVPAAAVLTATDNCSTPTVGYTQTSTQNASVNNAGYYNYTLTRTWTATDACGNTSNKVQVITVQDKTSPVIVSCPASVTQCNDLAGNIRSFTFAATDNCSPLTTTYSIMAPNGSIVNGSGNTITTGFAIGKTTITWTVKDVSGNTNSCITIVVVKQLPDFTISSVPTSSVYTGGNNNNLYLGYGAQSTKLQITHTAISGNESLTYTYFWSGNLNGTSMLSSTTSAAPIFTPATSGYYTFTVVTTNNLGCSTTRSISICVTDIRVQGTNGSKVYVCHVPPGNPSNRQTLSISVNAVPAHLGNHIGDRLGSCDQTPCGNGIATSTGGSSSNATKEVTASTVSTEEELKVTVMPNPSTTYFTLKLESKYQTPVSMRVMDASGRVVDAKSKIGSNSTIQIGHNYSSGTYYAELIQGAKRKVVQLIKGRG